MALTKTTLEEPIILQNFHKVKVTRMGHLIEVQHMTAQNKKAHTLKLSKDEYINLATGEICEYQHNENRSQNINSLAKSFKKLRRLINNNFFGNKNELFITLTFAKDSFDTGMIYEDCDKFLKRLRYHYKDISTVDYINVVEPHASGQFHTHMLLRFNDVEEIHMTNARLSKLWKHGLVDVKTLEQVDNIGAYLSAYLSDLELPSNAPYHEGREDIKIVEKDGEKKKFLKGGRLKYYPSGMQLVRSSKGIEAPESEEMGYGELKKEVRGANPNYSKSVRLESDEYKNTITYEQYNLKR